jgi:hypothetical protein
MRLDAHFDMLPVRAFQKRGFGNAPATLEGGGKGGGGGGGQPTQSTAYQTNVPEYAKPYVMNMLGAAQNQLFETTPGTDGGPGTITGFKPYTPYSTDPTNYFAGPSSLQRQVYGEAGQMQTPGQFAPATGLAGMAGQGQLGTTQQAGIYGGLGTALGAAGAMQAMPAFSAGQQFASQVTDPRSMAQYMSPYQQAVTDVAKNAAVREAQLAQQATNLGAARQGTYGGARQALMQGERERNLLSNLSNIQAQGSQSAFDRAMQTQQFGANLGLQGIQTGLQGVQTGMQGIGQGLQGVGAQQAGFAGAGQAASTLGQLGGAQQQADLARMGFQQQTGREQQAYQQNIINQAIQDYATAQQYPYMQLSTMSNLLRGLPMQSMSTQQYQAQPSTTQQLLGLAGTGASLYGAMGRKEGGSIKEYAVGGGVKASLENKIDDIADAGGVKGLQGLLAQTKSPAAKELIMERMREEGITAAPTGSLGRNMAGGGIIAFAEGDLVDENYDYNQSGYGTLFGSTRAGLAKERAEEERKRKEAFLAENAPEALAAMRKREAEPKGGFTESSFKDFDKAQALLEKERYGNTPPPPPAGAPAAGTTTGTGVQSAGLDAILADRRRRLGIDGPGEKSEAFMKAMEERQAGMGKQTESDRYLRMAEAFARFGSTAGPIGKAASEALGGFAKGEAAARKDQDKMQLEGMKMQADLEKARRAEERGDLDAAERFYNSAKDRENRINVANASANRQVELIERAMKDPAFLDTLRATKGLDSKTQQTALTNYVKWESGAGLSDPKFRELAKAVKDKKEGAVQALETYKEEKYNDFLLKAGGKSSGATSSGSGKVDASNPLLK